MSVPTLFKPPAAVPVNLTPRQQAAWDYVCASRRGVTAQAVGLNWHRIKGGDSILADYATQDGLSVLRSAALKPLVIRRKTGLWEPRDPAYRATQPTAQGGDIPW